MNCCVALASTAVGDDEPDTGDVVSDVLTGTTDTADTQGAFVNIKVMRRKVLRGLIVCTASVDIEV
jgi:hypothetical protein